MAVMKALSVSVQYVLSLAFRKCPWEKLGCDMMYNILGEIPS